MQKWGGYGPGPDFMNFGSETHDTGDGYRLCEKMHHCEQNHE